MKKQLVLSKIASAIILTMTVTSCVRFDNRTQAEGNFDYQDVTLIDSYQTGEFSREEERKTYFIRPLTEQQESLGLRAEEVDIRPPSQLIPVLDGVLLDVNPLQTKVWVNAFRDDGQIEQKAWDLVSQYLAANNVTPVASDRSALTIETGLIVTQREYGSWGKNIVREEAEYKLQFETAEDGRSLALIVDIQSFKQLNDGVAVKQNLEGRTKRGLEINFVNQLLQFAYDKKEADLLDSLDNKPLPIKLGFDDNHQTAWIIDTEFIDAWRKLPALFKLMSFDIVEQDKNLGFYLLEFKPQNIEYWLANSLNPINLEKAEYFVQLGELTGGETSLVWLDEDKKPLPDQQVSDLYLSITGSIRTVITDKDVQTKPL